MSATVPQIEQLVHEGKFLEARSKAETLLRTNDHIRLKQLLALSMAKSGSPKAAMDFLEPVYKQQPDDPETSGILGSIYKELFKETKNSKYAALSKDTYLANFRLTKNYYTGINAASMSAISGSLSKAREIAKEIISQLAEDSTDVWEVATLAEAHLLLQEKSKAVDLYLRCRAIVGSDWGKVNSIYNQLWLLNHYVAVSNQVLNIFSPPGIAAFVGHMIDHPSREFARFPANIEMEVKDAIIGALKTINAKIGYCSMACGGDILFAEAMLETGGELNLFLPFDTKDFIETSVDFAGSEWVDRFGKLMSQSRVHHITKEPYDGNDDLFTLQARVIFGSAINRSKMLHSSAHLLSVFADADIKVKEGGTRDTMKLWPANEKRLNINPQNFLKEPITKSVPVSSAKILAKEKNEQRKVRFLLSMVLGSSTEEERERFNYHTAKRIDEMKAEEAEIRDDGFLTAFKTVTDCVTLAWSILKTKAITTTKIKVALHAGPVMMEEEPCRISGNTIRQVTSIHEFAIPGKVYASFQFSSALALESDKYAIEFAGLITADDGSKLEIFQVNRHQDAFEL
jgi:hypothetical protein